MIYKSRFGRLGRIFFCACGCYAWHLFGPWQIQQLADSVVTANEGLHSKLKGQDILHWLGAQVAS